MKVYNKIILISFFLISFIFIRANLSCAGQFFNFQILCTKTVNDVVKKYGDEVEKRLGKTRYFAKHGFPKEILIYANKSKRMLGIYARADVNSKWTLVKMYPFTGFSGKIGAKTKEGDRQIPEGIYKIESLNPNSRYHLSLRISYPNSFDKKMAKAEHRTNLGGDIMIHGKNVTIGCIPVGDAAIEEIFVMSVKSKNSIPVILTPENLSHMSENEYEKFVRGSAGGNPAWYPILLDCIRREMIKYQMRGCDFF